MSTTAALTKSKPLPLAETLPPEQNPAAVYLARLGPGSRRTMLGALETIAGLLSPGCSAMALPWAALRYQHTQAVRSVLAERYAPATANKMLSALRGVLREAFRLGQMSAEEHGRAVDLLSVRGQRVLAGRALDGGELRALLGVCDVETAQGARDAALVALGYCAGLRRSELVELNVDDFNAESGELLVRGKSSKERLVYATNGALDALVNWLRFRGHEPGPMVVPIDKVGRLSMRRMSSQAAYYILARLAARAGVSHFSPHDLRRSCISDLLDAGADVSSVQKLAGHAKVETTIRYDRRPERAKRRAAELLHVPFPTLHKANSRNPARRQKRVQP